MIWLPTKGPVIQTAKAGNEEDLFGVVYNKYQTLSLSLSMEEKVLWYSDIPNKLLPIGFWKNNTFVH